MRTPDEPDTDTSPRRARTRPGAAFPRRSAQATWRRRIARAAGRVRNRAGDDALPPPATSSEQFGHPSGASTETLCAVLDERRDDINSEDVVDALFDVADPASVPSLRRAVTWVPDWDEFGQLARKAVWALDRIGTPEAIAAIREEVTDDAPFKVVEAAREALERLAVEEAAFERLRAAIPDDLPPPASPDVVKRAEAQVGERLPRLLRRVYLELANGGWGPGDGVYGLAGGHRDDQGDDSLTVHALLTRPDPEFPAGWTLPRPWLPLAHAGEARQFCVDCRSGGGRVVLLDPAVDPGGPLDDAVLWQRVVTEEFIRLWLDGQLDRSVVAAVA
jgi:hypothetical protein